MNEVYDVLSEFYSARPEDERFSKRHWNVEYLISLKYIEKYLKPNERIIEIGAGTGKYSLYFAHKGYEVDAIELLDINLDVLKKNILPDDKINARLGNALDLSFYPDESFDITLLLGPMYHLFTREDKLKALSEAKRVTKKGGKIFVAYCQFDASMILAGFKNGMYGFLVENKLLDEETLLPISNPFGIFELYRKEQIDGLNEALSLKRLHYVGTDMFSHYIPDEIDEMNDEMFEKYLRYTLSICENQNIVGASNHTLDVLEK